MTNFVQNQNTCTWLGVVNNDTLFTNKFVPNEWKIPCGLLLIKNITVFN